MGLDNSFYSSDRELETEEDGVTIKRSEEKYVTHLLGYTRKEWDIHQFIAEDFIERGGSDDYSFNGDYYDITHLVPDLFKAFNEPEYEYLFSLFRDILWELAKGKRIIYSGDY